MHHEMRLTRECIIGEVACYSIGPTMKRAALLLAAIILVVGGFFAYCAFAKHRDLEETMLWMDQTYNPHEGGENWGHGHGEETHYLENDTLHTEEVTKKFRQTFTYKGGCTIVIHHETVPIGLYKNLYTNGDYTFSLCDVDPDSIKIKTYDFYKDVFDCADPEQVKAYELECTSAEIEFHTTNEMAKIKDDYVITYAEIKGKGHETENHGHITKAWFTVDDVAYAQRFAKALRHAVELCGGKTSKF